MGYTNCLMVSTMKKLNLFDNISYKYIKDIIDEDDNDFEVEIEDLDCDRIAYCKTRFKFEINIDVSGGCMPMMVDRKFVVEKEYNSSSAYALMMLELQEEDEEEEEEEEEEDEKMRYTAYLIKNEFKMLDGDVIGAKKSINVAGGGEEVDKMMRWGGGLRNGNDYAEVQVIYIDKEMTKPNAVFYQEFGNNPFRKLIGDDVEWVAIGGFKVLNNGKVEDDSDEENEDDEN
jgi:hypothetical protein